MPDFLPWSDIYGVRIQKFDVQHKALFRIVNDLHQAMGTGGNRGVASALNELIDFFQTHFAAEESAMQQHGFAGLDRHRAEHAQLTGHLADFKRKFDAGKVTVSLELLTFLQAWIKHHILLTDKTYSSHLTAQGMR